MPSGGARPGAGRPRGSYSKRLGGPIVGAHGETPLQFMLRIMRDENQPMDLRAEMASRAAPFCHPRMNPIGPAQNGERSARHLTITIRDPKPLIDVTPQLEASSHEH